MAIRDRVRRALTKSDSSSNISHSGSSSNITTTTTATTTSDGSESSSLRKSPSKLFSWRSHDREHNSTSDDKKKADKEQKKKTKKSSSKPVHPRDKPLTATNLRHQEMLSGFSMTFGSSPNRLSQLVANGFDDDGVSPCCTRYPSFDGGAVDPTTSYDCSSTSLSSDVMVPPPKVQASADY